MSKNSVMVQISLSSEEGEMHVEISEDFFAREARSIKNNFLLTVADLAGSGLNKASREFLTEFFNWLPTGCGIEIENLRSFRIWSDSPPGQTDWKRISELIVFLFAPIFGPDRREDVEGDERTIEFFPKEAAEFDGPLEDHWSGLENYMPGCPRLSGE